MSPTANIGLRTGIMFDVLDIDGPEGVASLALLAPGYKHTGPVASTGKGHHLLFAVTGAKNGANLRPKLDFRGLNGYIVGAPSIHPSGRAYEWLRPMTLPLPVAPVWLLDLVAPVSQVTRVPRTQDPTTAAILASYDIVTEFSNLGLRLKRSGPNLFKTTCPFHSDDTPSLGIYVDTQSFYCFGCQAWGDVINLHNWKRTGHLR